MFAVGGSKLWEILGDGTVGSLQGGVFMPGIPAGDVGAAITPAQIFSNGNQLFIVSGAKGYLDNGITVVPVVDAVQGGYLDGYFIAQQPNGLSPQSGKQFKISALLDGSMWDPLDFASAEGSPDNISGIITDHEELVIFKFHSIEIWIDNGAANFPFTRIQGAYIEQGCFAPYSIAKLDNSIFWLGGDDRGAGVVWRLAGYTPIRVSNHAMESQIQSYSTLDDAISFTFQENGHSFLVISFPTAKATWVYDVSTQMWSEWLYWNLGTAQYEAHRGRFHCYAFGGGTPSTINPYFPPQHFVGDYQNGNIYVQSLNEYSDAGNPIRRLRSSPAIQDELKWMKYGKFVLDCQTGFLPPGLLESSIVMQISNDGGLTWLDEQRRTFAVGEFPGPKKIYWNRGGRSRDRAYRVIDSDPVQSILIDGYADVQPGNGG